MKAGLIGKKLGHTASPAIHEKIFQAMGVSGTYDVLEMPPDSLAENLKRLAQDGYTGCNVTIPYKRDVMPYLTDISREARIIGAVNTIHFTDEGAFGYNTDYGGFGRSLEQAGIGVAGQDCVVLGTGGAARAIIQYLADKNARSITIVSRQPHSKIEFDAFTKKIGASEIDYQSLEMSRGGDVLVNCTPVGMFPRMDGCPVSEACIAAFPAVVDLIYNPKDTELLKTARRHGARTRNGMYMLVAQAVGAEELWTGQKIASSIVEQIAKEMEHLYE
ncbi:MULTISPECIES: shikimate dehydrogenase [unclassified Megasphaera]|uniref:shikimate dehydrogenase n=1 Tax=unclassified Megasphaera TaxID=2626256 RepID=UPI00073EFED3|nr:MULTISPECIES: shikimate dehydrogenase [unclassified Megasphaera]KUH57210.1 shikimate dehydrogenase [Megasphaera sp. DJF_B143]MDY2904852.1 shikimate dehydrogenase [Caecibacter massiliensis]